MLKKGCYGFILFNLRTRTANRKEACCSISTTLYFTDTISCILQNVRIAYYEEGDYVSDDKLVHGKYPTVHT